jgi:hypothetical protein
MYRAMAVRACSRVEQMAQLTRSTFNVALKDSICALLRTPRLTRPAANPKFVGHISEHDGSAVRATTRVKYGFSLRAPAGRNPHYALVALTLGIERKRVGWVLDADIHEFSPAWPSLAGEVP